MGRGDLGYSVYRSWLGFAEVLFVNLDLQDFWLDIHSASDGVFFYEVSFRFSSLQKPYRGKGTAPSPSQCFDAAMKYLAECMREAV